MRDKMKIYEYEEWDIKEGTEYGGFDERIYVDLSGNPITGILKDFYGFADKEKNDQCVKNGKRFMKKAVN